VRIPSADFGHGRTRNLLVREARGRRVALLSQDAEPAEEDWLERLLEGFELGEDVAIVYGPYLARANAGPAVRGELEAWFGSLSDHGRARVERLSREERARLRSDPAARIELAGGRGFFTDANACLDRGAWERVPYREISYAEDRALALDMLAAGYAKAYVPEAAVLHSHTFTTGEELRRAFLEWRALREIYGYREPLAPGHVLSRLRGQLGLVRRDPAFSELPSGRRLATLALVTRRNLARLCGALLGSRAEALPRALTRVLSGERCGGPQRGAEPRPGTAVPHRRSP
jgi:rhamnosyltransferase